MRGYEIAIVAFLAELIRPRGLCRWQAVGQGGPRGLWFCQPQTHRPRVVAELSAD